LSTNGLLHHYLRALVMPRSIALVGATERTASLGRRVCENLLAGAFAGDVHLVNPGHREVLGRKSWPGVSAIGAPVDLAVITVAPDAVRDVLEDAAKADLRVAILVSDWPPGSIAQQRKWAREIAQLAARHAIRLIGPGAFGIVRPGIGLNASITDVPVRHGGLALVAQSGAVATAMLDFAAPLRIGFSIVLSIGGGADLDFGELLDCLLLDQDTDGILLYVESVRNARRFVSALRSAARTKPVVVLKAGRSTEPRERDGALSPDAVFDAVVRRAGTVRVRTYTQLFAAARILALGRIPRGDRIAIVANGRGPAMLAADSAIDRNVKLARLEPATEQALEALLPQECMRNNPVDLRADAPPERLATAVRATLADANVDAVVVLHVPRPSIPPVDAARAVAEVARGAQKPVLAAWLGAIDRPDVQEVLEAGDIANFYTPENAVDAFSFLAAYGRHQRWLLEVPPPQPELERPDLDAAAAVLSAAQNERRTTLREPQVETLLRAFGIEVLPSAQVKTQDEACEAARRFGYPVSLSIERASSAPVSALTREHLRDARSVQRAFAQLAHPVRSNRRTAPGAMVVRKQVVEGSDPALSLAVYTDATFGPVIAFGTSRRVPLAAGERALALPPLNRRLAAGLVNDLQGSHALALDEDVQEGLLRLMLRVSTLACALPWVIELELDPVLAIAAGPVIGSARIAVDHRRARIADYAHMAIHPYPSELEATIRANDGTTLVVRPIRPEDAELERRFVAGLSEETRFRRFFYRLHELTPSMLARFTQVDYDRELALVAVADEGSAGASFAAVARFVQSPDGVSAEYAIVVHDAWQRQGIGQQLMAKLIEAARRKGLRRLQGAVLRENTPMLKFVAALGFSIDEDPGDPEQVTTALDLAKA
jgi:acetyltransferase